MFTDYTEFEITIQARVGDAFPIYVSCPLGGEAIGTLRLPSADPVFQELSRKLAALDISEAELATIGRMLFESLFDGRVREVYDRSRGGLRSGQALRLVFNVAAGEREVGALPWEFLHDPDWGPLGLQNASIVRYLPQPSAMPTLKTPLPLRVLLSGAATPPKPDIERELGEVHQALADLERRDLVQIAVEPHLTPQKLQALLRQDFHVWHFVGHGGFDREDASGRLYFEDATGDIEAISATQLGLLLNGSGLRLIVLDACKSARLSTYPFHSVAPALIRAQIPAVIAMQFSVPQEATRAFAGEFYRALAQGFPIDACVTEGRRSVMIASGLRRPDWGIPVVYTRARDGRLLELAAPRTRAAGAAPTTQQFEPVPLAPPPAAGRQPATATARVFISYKRNTRIDEPLARRLYEAFRAAGHSVFIDQTMRIGTEWAREIERHIRESDYMVVLLSASSVNSEMVAMELECAHRQMQQTGKARLLPVRVAYDDLLPYQISHYLDKLQYAEWHDDGDTARLIGQLLDALGAQAPLPLTAEPAAGLASAAGIPRPYADPRFVETLREPGGGVKLRSEFYIERDADRRLQRELQKAEGVTVTIRAPRQTGKTSLLIRGIAQAQSRGSRVVALDMQAVEDRQLESLDTFLRYFTQLVFARLRLDPALVDKAWSSGLGAPDKATYLFEDHVLPAGENMVLAIDEADRLLKTSYHDNFFGLLRFWHNSRAMNELWDRLDILMVISTEPHLLISDVSQSPFNVGAKIVLDDFSPQQAAELNRRYRTPLDDQQLQQLIDLLGGHPYLISRALYTLVAEGMTWPQLARAATEQQSPFGDHLRRYLWLLHDQPQLSAALKQVIGRGSCPDEVSFYRLMQAGLIAGVGSQSCRCRCRLYELYLKDKL